MNPCHLGPGLVGTGLLGPGLEKYRSRLHDTGAGEMAEWLKAHAWKACIRETVSWVRIPLSPPVWPLNILKHIKRRQRECWAPPELRRINVRRGGDFLDR